ncbi:MAG: hypothetical protein NUW23_15835 [Firmicutes bacterium]|nr:hypothetical protein [Bacillota bacterium]
MKFTRLLCVVTILVLLGGAIASAQSSKYAASIPPEILALYSPEIVAGERPKIVPITLDLIWTLRTNPNLGADIYQFSFTSSQVASAQKDILRDWIFSGASILLLGNDEINRYIGIVSELLSQPGLKAKSTSGTVSYSPHPVNTNVRESRFFGTYALHGCSDDTEVIAARAGAALAGRIPFGAGSVYFANVMTSGTYGDRDRWLLNFYQWLLGMQVPGALDATVRTVVVQPSIPSVSYPAPTPTPAPAQSQAQTLPSTPQLPPVSVTPSPFAPQTPVVLPMLPAHQIVLRTGESVWGELATTRFLIQTPYANLWFGLESVLKVTFGAPDATADCIMLRSGDILYGTIWPETISIRPSAGWPQREIPKHDIREVLILR